MKRLLVIAMVLAAGMVAFSGCHSSSGGSKVVYPNSMTATIAGVLAFNASGGNVTAIKSNGTLMMTATSDANAKIVITMPSFPDSIATFNITNVSLPVGATYDSLNNGHQLTASRGTITFTAVSPYLQGTFSFVCSDSARITDGTFKIKAP